MTLSRGRKMLVLAGANMVGFAIAALMAEGILRWAHIPYQQRLVPTENAIAEFDSALGWSYKPGISKKIRYGVNERWVHIDGNRIRVPGPGHRLSRTQPSILFVGCSYTMGHGVSWEESFPGQFAALVGERLQVVNLGVQGYGTDQALLALERYLPSFNAKVVVYTFLEDHIIRNGNRDRRMLCPECVFLGTKPQFEIGADGRPRLFKRPALYQDIVTSYLLDAIIMRGGGLLGQFPPRPLSLTRALIREMSDVSARQGARFVVVNWRWREDGFTGIDDLEVPVIDTMQDAPAGWSAMLIPSDAHPDPTAHRHVALSILRYLDKQGLIGESRE